MFLTVHPRKHFALSVISRYSIRHTFTTWRVRWTSNYGHLCRTILRRWVRRGTSHISHLTFPFPGSPRTTHRSYIDKSTRIYIPGTAYTTIHSHVQLHIVIRTSSGTRQRPMTGDLTFRRPVT